jgi:D-aminopeptidase
MKVYLSVDMEGLAGVSHDGPTSRGDLGYPASVVLEVEYANAGQADRAAIVPGAERYDDRGVRITAADAVSGYRGFLAGIRPVAALG